MKADVELTYVGTWIQHSPDSFTLQVGDYIARAYRLPRRKRWEWRAMWRFVVSNTVKFEQIGHDETVADSATAKTAAITAIRQHHGAQRD